MPSHRKRRRGDPAAASSSNEEPAATVEVSGGGQQWLELANLWRAGDLLDCKINVDGRTFEGHRVVLSASSAFLRGCFCGGLAESDSATVTARPPVEAA